MNRVLWLDCSSGIAGDMLAAALIDTGGDRLAMERALASLPMDGFTICVSHVQKSSIRCCDFDVVLQPGLETHDHDMDHLFGHLDDAEYLSEEPHGEHAPGEEHNHAAHAHHHHHPEHRGLGDVLTIISEADLTPGARSLAQKTFFILADAEAEAHGATRDTVHFHEVGSVDSIVDIVACAVLADSLHPDAVHVTALTEGSGRIRTSHGVLPVPVPAVAAILKAYEIPVRISPNEGEFITPTGAALVAALATSFEAPAALSVRATGYGAGKRTYPWSNYVRAVVGTTTDVACSAPLAPVPMTAAENHGSSEASQSPVLQAPVASECSIVKLECEIDDVTGEAMGTAISELMEAGAKEAHWIPLGTKKGRPAWQLQVICAPEDRERLELVIFRTTTTIGIRSQLMERTVLPREALELEVELAPHTLVRCAAKRATLPDGTLRIMPEANAIDRIAREHHLAWQAVWQAALAACSQASRERE